MTQCNLKNCKQPRELFLILTIELFLIKKILYVSIYLLCHCHPFLMHYKCYRYGHTMKDCRDEAETCPKCGNSHKFEECKTNQTRCTNCCRVNDKHGFQLSADHEVLTYRRVLASQKKLVY